jgi:hypothetical protein
MGCCATGKKRRLLLVRRKANWVGHILRGNCLIKHVTEGKLEGRSDGKRRKKA